MLQAFDPRNKDLVVNINGRLVHRDQAESARSTPRFREATRCGKG
jgi:hypothetical protein